MKMGNALPSINHVRVRSTKRLSLLGFAVITLGLIVWSAPAAATNGPAYPDSTQSVQNRVNDLLSRMTLAEKVGQMDMIEVTQVTDNNPNNQCAGAGFNQPNPVCAQQIFIDNHTGATLAGGTDIPPDTTTSGQPGNPGLDWATEYNAIQRFA